MAAPGKPGPREATSWGTAAPGENRLLIKMNVKITMDSRRKTHHLVCLIGEKSDPQEMEDLAKIKQVTEEPWPLPSGVCPSLAHFKGSLCIDSGSFSATPDIKILSTRLGAQKSRGK